MEIEIAFADLLGGRAEPRKELTHARSAVEAAEPRRAVRACVRGGNLEPEVFWRGSVADLDVVRSAIKFEDPDRIVSFFLPSIGIAQLFFRQMATHSHGLRSSASSDYWRTGRAGRRGVLPDACSFLESSAATPIWAERHRLAAEELVSEIRARPARSCSDALAPRFRHVGASSR